MVKNYNDKQLLDRVKQLQSFKQIPNNYWILGVQSENDEFNVFDDKFYLFNGEQFVLVTSGTTNAGKNGLMKYKTYNPDGVAVIKTNEIYYDVWKFGLHRGKMEALRQNKPFLISRDGNRDENIDENKSFPVMCGINFHANTYNLETTEIKKIIGGWSLGCQVVNNIPKYNKIIELVKSQKIVTYCLIKEF
jgi:hypothetical protein